MAIIRRANLVQKFNNIQAIESAGLPGVNIVKNAEDESLVVLDGATGNKFQISDDNTLTFEEILEKLDQEGLILGNGGGGTISLGPKLIPVNFMPNITVTRSGWFGYTLNETADLDVVRDGLLAYKFLPNEIDEVWASIKMPEDYVVGTSINFVVDWITSTTSSGSLIWGMEYSIADPSTNSLLPQSELAILECSSSNGGQAQQYQTFSKKLDVDNVITSPNLKAGAIMHIRLFRNGVADACNAPIFLSNFSIEYTGKVL